MGQDLELDQRVQILNPSFTNYVTVMEWIIVTQISYARHNTQHNFLGK
jgi:hypothetical protein